MARLKCLNGRLKMARQNCTFKWQGKSEHLDEKT